MNNQHMNEDINRHQDSKHPSPDVFEEFVPWACNQLQVPFIPVIKKMELLDYNTKTPGTTGRKGQKNKKVDAVDEDSATDKSSVAFGSYELDSTAVLIYTMYDNNKKLVQLKFQKNVSVPNILIKIIALAIPFHTHLTSIYIDRGLNQSAMYELWNLISISKVTELILDNTEILQANYYLLLAKGSPLKYLSMARCKLNDQAIENIAQNLICPLSAGRNLCILVLTSNRITDVGAKYLGDALKVNRKLCYLNVSGNMITDIGAKSILDSLKEYPLSSEDVKEKKIRYFTYLKEKNALVKKTMYEMRNDEFEKQNAKKKIKKTLSTTTKKHKESEKISQVSVAVIDKIWYDKAEATAIASLGAFRDAFSADNTLTRGGVVYCLGNNIMCNLNLSYNNLTYFSVKNIYDVLCTQKQFNRNPRGLIKVSIEGNNIPESCIESSEIDSILQSYVIVPPKTASAQVKRLQSKTSAK